MRRREFITLVGGAAVWPLAARGQQQGKLPTIGFLGSATPSSMSQWTAAFVQRLHELGWIEGRTVAIEYRWAEGSDERYRTGRQCNRLVAPVARHREQTARIASRGGSRLAPSGHSASRGQSCEC